MRQSKGMDDALSLYEFLPVSFRNKDEEKYIQFLQNAFEKNYEIGSFEFAGLAFHLLYMSFFCFSVWQIKLARKVDFDRVRNPFTLSKYNISSYEKTWYILNTTEQ